MLSCNKALKALMIIFGFGCANLMAQPKVLCFFVYDYGYDGATRDVLVLVLLASLVSSVRARTILAISRRFLAYFGLFWTI